MLKRRGQFKAKKGGLFDRNFQLLKHLNKSVKDELNMLDYLVEWARIKFASEAFTPSTIDIYQYILKALETSQVNALAKQVLLENNISANTFVYADGKMLYSIIQNILSNAIKHSSSGGVVLVSSYTEDNAVVVVIKDNGCGMSEDTLQNLFIPKLESLVNDRKDNQSAGIGLLLTKSSIETNGGKIWVESSKDNGTSFYFSLPMNEPQPKINKDNSSDFSDIISNA